MTGPSPTPPEDIDPYTGGYIAGLIDGEGSFHMTVHIRGTVRPTFSLEMRDDDRPLLEWLVTTTGLGTVYRRERRPPIAPQAKWAVFNNRDVLALVGLLTRYPLRGKKRRDFEVWKRAVSAVQHTTHHPRSGQNKRIQAYLLDLRYSLRAVRAYPANGMLELPDLAPNQPTLFD